MIVTLILVMILILNPKEGCELKRQVHVPLIHLGV